MMRLDQLLVDRGLVNNRIRAGLLINNGKVLVNGEMITKSGKKFPIETDLNLLEKESPYSSRGTFKFIAKLDNWSVGPNGKICMDIGASTCDFTQVLLERGATKVYAIDSGSNQLYDTILENPKDINLEKCNFRYLDDSPIFSDNIELFVMDVSFISQTLLYTSIKKNATPNSEISRLVKPQFEAGREEMGKKGVIKKQNTWEKVIQKVKPAERAEDFTNIEIMNPPIEGGDGNREFLMHMKAKN